MSIPDWVKEIRDSAVSEYGKGLAVKQSGERYYLYKRSSKRVTGKKNPQVTETYIGAITRSGLVLREKGLSQADIEVWEYGFSRVLLTLVPSCWKAPLKDEWMSVFLEIIRQESPNSYLLRNAELNIPEDIDLPVLKQKLLESISEDTFCRLKPLKLVYLLYFPDHVVLSHVSEEQSAIAREYHVDLSVLPARPSSCMHDSSE